MRAFILFLCVSLVHSFPETASEFQPAQVFTTAPANAPYIQAQIQHNESISEESYLKIEDGLLTPDDNASADAENEGEDEMGEPASPPAPAPPSVSAAVNAAASQNLESDKGAPEEGE